MNYFIFYPRELADSLYTLNNDISKAKEDGEIEMKTYSSKYFIAYSV